MIEAFQYINKAFESKVRLGIMAILMVNEEADFNFLKEQLSLTDGNLASLWILENNINAGRLYRRIGFKETGRKNAITNKLDEIEFALT